MKLGVTKASASSSYNGLGDQLYDLGGARPTLDLNFSSNESLVDSVTGKTLVDHTRQSSATYVDGDGVIRTAVTNLLVHSEDFNITGGGNWSPSSVTITTGQLDPIGGNNAFKLSTTNPSGAYLYQDPASVGGDFASGYRRSIWAKVATGTAQVHILGRTDASNSLVTLTDQWQRFDREIVDGTFLNYFYAVDFRGSSNTTEIYVWGAQLEQSSTVGEYVKTTTAINSAPRFDHDPETGESLGLLVEESRTNLLVQSEDFSTTWTATRASVSANAITAPNGTVTADKLIEDDTASNSHFVEQSSISFVSGTNYTFSVYVKSAEKSQVRLAFLSSAFGSPVSYNFDLSAVTATQQASGTNDSGSIVSIGDGWYRCRISAQATASVSATVSILLLSAGQALYTGDGTSGIYLWGAQLEAGSFPTSYIPTEGSQVTRAADVTSITGRNFGSVNLLSYSEEFDQASWSLNRLQAFGNGSVANAIVSPAGTVTADRIEESTATGQHYVAQSFTAASGTTYTVSVYLKVDNTDFAYISIEGAAFTTQRTLFDLNAGTASAFTGSGFSFSITSAGNGWFRCSMSNTATSSGAAGLLIGTARNNSVSFTGVAGTGVYLWGAQLEEGSTATDYIKSDVNWTSRASNATYYDVNGTLKKSSYNLVTYSEEFDDSFYSYSTRLTVDPNTAVAPNGTFTADKIIGTSNNDPKYGQFTANVVSGFQYVFSLYAKKDEYEVLQLQAANANFAGTLIYANFDLANGSLGSFADCLPIIDSVGNGWYRCSIVLPAATSSGSNAFRFSPYASGDPARLASYTGDGTSGIYVWGAQLETGTYAGDYAKTEGSAASTARTAAYLPDGNGNFVSAGDLLLEGAGTNLLTDSEDLTGYDLRNVTAPFDSSAINPTGTTGSYKISANSGSPISGIRINSSASSANNIVVSAFVKKSTYRYVLVGFGGLTNSFTALFDIEPGLTSNRLLGQGGKGTRTNIDAGYQNLPNDWIRIWAVGTTNGTDGPTLGMGPDATTFNITNWTAAGTEEIYAWGLQYENNASYPTSYIPTSGSTATRAADVSTSAATFGNSWYEQSEGTVFNDSTVIAPNVQTQAAWSFTGGTYVTSLRQPQGTGDRFRAQIGNTFTSSPGTGNTLSTGTKKACVAYSGTAGRLQVGSSSDDVTAGGVSDPTDFYIGSLAGGSLLNGTINRLTYWPTRLSNDTLQTITV